MVNTVSNKRNIVNLSPLLIWSPVFLLPLFNMLSLYYLKLSIDIRIQTIIGAIIEELFFRFFLYKVLVNQRDNIIWISCLFSLFHLFNIKSETVEELAFQMIFAFCFSLWAGMVVYNTKNITIPIITHVFINITGSGSTAITSSLMCVVAFFCGVLLLKTKRIKGSSYE